MEKAILKRVLVTLLAVCMVTVLISNVLPRARAAEDHTHPDDDVGTQWIPLTLQKNSEGEKDVLKAGETLIHDNHLPAGNYYLAEDMTLSSSTTEGGAALYIAGTSALCLNGHTLNGRFDVENGYDLTVSDCGKDGTVAYTDSAVAYIRSGGAFRLVSGTLSSTGGSIYNFNVYVSDGGTFVMRGGAVTATKQVGVNGRGTIEISGGTISSGYEAVQASGSDKFILSGSPAIIGGEENGNASIFLGKDKLITLQNFTGAPNGQPYTVRTPDTSVHQFAEGAVSADAGSFVPKTEGLVTEYREGGQLWFTKHEHQWDEGWTYDETQHWHACLGVGACDVDKYEAAAHTADPDEWQDDAETGQHYKKCSVCGAEFSRGDHEWVKGVIADGTRTDTCKTCGATRTVEVYGISGKVTTESGDPVSNAKVELKQGNKTIAEGTTNENGAYSFPDVEPGVYNVVVTAEGKTVTAMAVVASADLPNQDLVIPQSDVSSELTLSLGQNGSVSSPDSIPSVVVGGLQEEAIEQAKSDTDPFALAMVAWYYGDYAPSTLNGAAEVSEAIMNEFASAEKADVKFQIYDFGVEKEKTSNKATSIDTIREINSVLTIVVPYSLGGRTNVAVHRYHDEEVQDLTRLWSKPAEPVDGTFWADLEHNLVYIYASKFSVYAISSTNGNNVSEKDPEPRPSAPAAPAAPTYATQIGQSEHGNVTASTAWTVSGGSVTLTVTPDEGYVLDALTVTDSAGKAVTVTDNGDGTYSFIMPQGGATVDAAFKLKPCDGGDACPSHEFADVDHTAWYHEGVDYVIRNKLMVGTSDTTFSPNGITTRAEMVQILYRLDGEPAVTESAKFDDVAAGQWYSDAVSWAAANKIVDGYGNGRFGPSDTVTREQMAAILYRYASYKGYDLTKTDDLTGYTDAASVSGWADTAMKWAVAEGIIEGTSTTTLSPSGNSTRAQVATIFMRFGEDAAK